MSFLFAASRLSIRSAIGRTCSVIVVFSLSCGATWACEAPPIGPRDITAMGYYTDAAHSVIDPALKRENEADTQGFDAYAKRVTGWVDDYVRTGDRAKAQCALAWLSTWAGNGAMLGKMVHVNNDQADYMRQWMLDSVSIAYVRVRPIASTEQRGVVEPWLKALANANLSYWENPHHTRNNHYYWTGLGVLATGLATGDTRLWETGHRIYRQGVQDIQPDGSLPMEMKRAKRALHYHDYAAAPLVMMAELARLQGQDWYGEGHHAIDRLARIVAHGYSDPSWFAERAGARQETAPPGSSSGWVELYRLRAPDATVFDAMHAHGPYVDPRLGGDLTLMGSVGILRNER